MKKIIAIFCSTIIFSTCLFAQQQTPQLLKQPAGWQFERFPLPPQFAPNIPFHGAEELRFSPGMFKKDAADYFTYTFVAELDDVTSISQESIQNYLLSYFKGLCTSTAKDRKLVIDTFKINVQVEKKNTNNVEVIYNVSANLFGVFADGAPVQLNMEVKVFSANSKIYLLFIASPLDKENALWQQLYTIQKDFKVPGK